MTKLSDMVPISSIHNLNVGLSSAREETMISCLGSPQMPLTIDDTPERASPLVRKLETFKKIGAVNADGIAPAVNSLSALLTKAFSDLPELKPVLRGDGMLVVRLRRPTSGHPSTKISNHAWGTAIDLKFDKMAPPGNTGHIVRISSHCWYPISAKPAGIPGSALRMTCFRGRRPNHSYLGPGRNTGQPRRASGLALGPAGPGRHSRPHHRCASRP